MQEEDDEAEVDGTGDEAQGVLYNFLPADIPSRPTDIELADSAVQVAQVCCPSSFAGTSVCPHVPRGHRTSSVCFAVTHKLMHSISPTGC